MEDKLFKADAKQIVDTAFDAKLFNDTMTRDNIKVFEDLIQYMLQSRYEGYVRTQKLLERIKETED